LVVESSDDEWGNRLGNFHFLARRRAARPVSAVPESELRRAEAARAQRGGGP
jgi:hypothetical protein